MSMMVACPAGDDRGFLLVFVTDTKAGVSKLHIYDAASMRNTPLAAVLMPQRVPFGFHGTFITAEQLKAHNAVAA